MTRLQDIEAQLGAFFSVRGTCCYVEKGDPKVAAGVYLAHGPSPAPRTLIAVCQQERDAIFIASTPADLQYLLSEVGRLRDELDWIASHPMATDPPEYAAVQNRAVAQVDANVFLAFDRLDDDQIVQEMKGAALSAYVYEFNEGGTMVRGLSKTGTDDAARIMAVKYGEALREVDCWLEREDEEAAYFKAKVTRFTIRDDGTAIELDAAIGHKRQPKFTYPKAGGKKANQFWYEQGGQKALRNAKQKLMPETIKQAIIAMYVAAGKVRKVRPEDVDEQAPRPTQKPVAPPEPPKVAPETNPALLDYGAYLLTATEESLADRRGALQAMAANLTGHEFVTTQLRPLVARLQVAMGLPMPTGIGDAFWSKVDNRIIVALMGIDDDTAASLKMAMEV